MADNDLQVAYDGRFLQMVKRGTWEFVKRKNSTGIVGILAITEDRKVVLIEQFRPPVGKRVIEIPAGLAGDVPGAESEEMATAAARELEEETGYRAERMEALAAGASSAGLCDEVISLFKATGLKKVAGGGGDGSEEIDVHLVPLDGIVGWLDERRRAGLLVDLKVYSALAFA